METKGFFQLEIIINVLVSSFRGGAYSKQLNVKRGHIPGGMEGRNLGGTHIDVKTGEYSGRKGWNLRGTHIDFKRGHFLGGRG